MGIKIDALDTLFFRDGKPFTMGAETWASGIFPPAPSVIYGALRSIYFSDHIGELSKANSESDMSLNLKINIICLLIGSKEYFPLPLDCAKEKGSRENKTVMLKPEPLNTISNCPAKYILRSDGNKKIESADDGWFDALSLNHYLKSPSDSDGVHFIKLSDHVLTEPKIGIGREALTHTTKDGMLYRAGMRRLESAMKHRRNTEKCYIAADFEELKIPDKGVMKIGGEGKAAAFEKIETVNIDAPQIEGKIFKLYLSTPAILKNGWLPERLDSKTLEGNYNGIRLKLLTAAIGKPLYIGGFDIKKREPKPMRKAVPAGSVYYFEVVENANNISIIDAFHGKAISDEENDCRQGFGIVFVGAVE